jgi:hypothetical protein
MAEQVLFIFVSGTTYEPGASGIPFGEIKRCGQGRLVVPCVPRRPGPATYKAIGAAAADLMRGCL